MAQTRAPGSTDKFKVVGAVKLAAPFFSIAEGIPSAGPGIRIITGLARLSALGVHALLVKLARVGCGAGAPIGEYDGTADGTPASEVVAGRRAIVAVAVAGG